MVDKELTEGEKELLKFTIDFNNFLIKNPKIRYNLHKNIKEINEKLRIIKKELE